MPGDEGYESHEGSECCLTFVEEIVCLSNLALILHLGSAAWQTQRCRYIKIVSLEICQSLTDTVQTQSVSKRVLAHEISGA